MRGGVFFSSQEVEGGVSFSISRHYFTVPVSADLGLQPVQVGQVGIMTRRPLLLTLPAAFSRARRPVNRRLLPPIRLPRPRPAVLWRQIKTRGRDELRGLATSPSLCFWLASAALLTGLPRTAEN